MIIASAPLRIALGGGGTDLPFYSSEYGGFVVSAAINKRVYVSIHSRFIGDETRLVYSREEVVAGHDEIQHPILREALKLMRVDSGVEIFSMSDVPGNSGLGSSAAFTVALLKALCQFKGICNSRWWYAETAHHIEADILKEPVGKQDQYISSEGGICAMTFDASGVKIDRLPIRSKFCKYLAVFYTAIQRHAGSVLREQASEITPGKIEAMHRIKAIGKQTVELLLRERFEGYGELLDEHWENKRLMTDCPGIIGEHYEAGKSAGAIGGKLIGAGGGGFLLFCVRPKERDKLCKVMQARGLKELSFGFSGDGARCRDL